MTLVKQRKGWRMSCDVGKATEGLENESSFSNLSVTSPTSQLILQPFRRFTNVTAHTPTLLSLYQRHSSFSNPPVALPTSQLILQPFRCFTYITAHFPTLPLLHLHHSSFSNPSFTSPTSQALHLIHLASRPWNKLRKHFCSTGSQPSYRLRCRTCPIHHPVNSFTSSCTNITYLITTHAYCKSMNLIYRLQCTECNAFYIGETCRFLSDRMNGHRFTRTVSNPDLPVAIHTKSSQIPFQECWSVSVIHKLPDSTPDHIRRQFEIAYQLILQS